MLAGTTLLQQQSISTGNIQRTCQRIDRMTDFIYYIFRPPESVGLRWMDTSSLWTVYSEAVNDRPALLTATLRPPSTDTQSTLCTVRRRGFSLSTRNCPTWRAIYNNSNTITVALYFTTYTEPRLAVSCYC